MTEKHIDPALTQYSTCEQREKNSHRKSQSSGGYLILKCISCRYHYKSNPMSERKYFFSNEIFPALVNDCANASALSAPYELTAMTRPPDVTI